MLALYKDPKGEKVFHKYEIPSLKSQNKTDSTIGTSDSALKKRILELENIIAMTQVDIIFKINNDNGSYILILY